MKNRNEIIGILNAARQLLPENNEITDDFEEVVEQLEEEWQERSWEVDKHE